MLFYAYGAVKSDYIDKRSDVSAVNVVLVMRGYKVGNAVMCVMLLMLHIGTRAMFLML